MNNEESDSTSLIGGDFCGHVATFTPQGRLIPVPEHFVPKVLLEWGQHPSYLEVIVSEETTMMLSQQQQQQEGEETTTVTTTTAALQSQQPYGKTLLLERHMVTIYPSVGCGVDNLDTTKTSETLLWTHQLSTKDVMAMDYQSYKHNNNNNDDSTIITRTETIFALPNQHRLRFVLDMKLGNTNNNNNNIQSPLRMYVERQTSTVSTKGTIADGGGLDGRTVSTLLGKDDVLLTTTTTTTTSKVDSDDERRIMVESPPGEDDNDDGVVVVRLPRGLTFAWDEERSSLTIQCKNQTIQRFYKDDGSVQMKVSGSVS